MTEWGNPTYPDWLWAKAVELGLIAGDPNYYKNGEATGHEYINAVMHSLIENAETLENVLARLVSLDLRVLALEADEPAPLPEPEPEPPTGGPLYPLEPPATTSVYDGPRDIYIDGTRVFDNMYFDTNIVIRSGLAIFNRPHFKAMGKEYAVAGWGGRARINDGFIEASKDGVKNNVDLYRTTIRNLYGDADTHGDCVQLQNAGNSSIIEDCFLDAQYGYGSRSDFGNAAIIVKNDLGSSGARQSITVRRTYMNGGNVTVMLHDGAAGPAPKATFEQCEWGGQSRYNKALQTTGNPELVWDVAGA